MLTIDDRENVKVKNKVLMLMGDHQIDKKGQAQVDRLPVGDYIIPEVGWGVEAKEINDLYQSITGQGRSRTVNAQLVDLADHFDIPFLVVYGTQLKPYVRGKPNRRDLAIQMERMKRTIKAFKETLHVRHPKIRFMQLETMDDFVSWLAQNHAQMMMAAKKQKNPFVISGMVSEKDPRIRMLCGIQGITPFVATNLLEKFGSIKAILDPKVTQKELMKTDGVSRQRARMIKKAGLSWGDS